MAYELKTNVLSISVYFAQLIKNGISELWYANAL